MGIFMTHRLLLIFFLLPAILMADFEGKVVSVSSGDTLIVERYGQPIQVHLRAIKAPNWGNRFGEQARRRLSKLVEGKKVTVKTNDLGIFAGVYGEVLLKQGTHINQLLVKEGLARWDRNADPGNDTLAVLEEEAQKARIGLWKDSDAKPIAESGSGFDRSGADEFSPIQAIKKDEKGRCHAPVSPQYENLEKYQTYHSLQECQASGGSLPWSSIPLGPIKILD